MISRSTHINKTNISSHSLLAQRFKSADYSDTFTLESITTQLNALQIYIKMVNQTPAWINALLSIRNNCVSILGLKDVGNLGGLTLTRNKQPDYRIGDTLDLFTIKQITDHELILTLSDSHLDITLSVLKINHQSSSSIEISTLVNYHNTLGKTYMTLIKPFHKLVVRQLLKKLSTSLTSTQTKVT